MRFVRRRPFAGRFAKAQSGVAAIEFALIFPFLLVLMLAGVQLVSYINATRRVQLVAGSISQMIAQAMPPGGTTVATVNAMDLRFSYDTAMVLFPYLLQDGPRNGILWSQDIDIAYASIQFTQKTGKCTNSADMSKCYTANVVWRSTRGSNYRSCSKALKAVDNTEDPSKTTLPRSVFGPGSLIAIDVVFTFRPTFGAAFLPAKRIARSVYLQPRYASLIDFDTKDNDGIATKCPGY